MILMVMQLAHMAPTVAILSALSLGLATSARAGDAEHQFRLTSETYYTFDRLDCAQNDATTLVVDGYVELRHPHGLPKLPRGREPLIKLRCAKIVFKPNSRILLAGSLEIEADTVVGLVSIHSARGLSGRPGEPGDRGGDGWDGGSVTMRVSNYAQGAAVKLYSPGGAGGNGGDAIRDRVAGNGGDGGDGGEVLISLRPDGSPPERIDIDSRGGSGGARGLPEGRNGFPGRMGGVVKSTP